MTDYEKLAELLFSHITKTPEEYEEKYPQRNLPEGARVTRFAPSPTGFVHLGSLFASLSEMLIARSTDGLFYLRIEDTDKKREVEDGVTGIVKGLSDFGINFDEGVMGLDEEKGDYGPYTQSKRKDIYQCFAKELVKKGLAYPCFCTEEDISQLRLKQENDGLDTKGYYGEFAKCRNLSFEKQKELVESGAEYTLRLRSPGKVDGKIIFEDLIKGKIEMPENIQDIVLLKRDGIPTYHFAHAVDDHLMRSTHIVRGDEWISSVPTHIQLFKACDFKVPKYAHISPIMKEDEETGGKRKLSKRKDPEAAVEYFIEQGYTPESVIEYLLTIANSNFEDWRRANPTADRFSFAADIWLSVPAYSGQQAVSCSNASLRCSQKSASAIPPKPSASGKQYISAALPPMGCAFSHSSRSFSSALSRASAISAAVGFLPFTWPRKTDVQPP